MKRRFFLRPIILTFFYQSILLLWTSFFYVTFIYLFNIHSPLALLINAGIILILAFSLTISWLLIMKHYARWRVWFFAAVNIFLGTGHFLVLASAAYWFLEFLNLRFGLHWPTIVLGRWFFLSAIIISGYGVWHSYQIEIKNYKIKIKGLPDFWKGRKIVMFADSHLGNIRGLNFIKQVVVLVNEQKPDLVLIPGDYYDGTPAHYHKLAEPLSNIHSKYGVFFCDGNHEEFKKNTPFVHALSQTGVTVLNNAFTEIHGLQIVGVEYKVTRGNRKLRNVLKKINFDQAKPTILMRHVPSAFKAAEQFGVDLMVSGHTHRAQVFPFNLLTKAIFKGYDYGHKIFHKMQVITTSGVGTWGPPQRVGTNSEIVSIILE